MPLSSDAVKDLVKRIHQSETSNESTPLIKQIEDGGWKLRVEAFDSIRTTAKRGSKQRLLKPKKIWKYTAFWVLGNDKVFYYTSGEVNKAEAMDKGIWTVMC